MKYTVEFMNSFKKSYKKVKKQGKDLKKLYSVIETLANGEALDIKYKDHSLINNKYYKNCRECHIDPNWLLIYKYYDSELVLLMVETGSHSELFDYVKPLVPGHVLQHVNSFRTGWQINCRVV